MWRKKRNKTNANIFLPQKTEQTALMKKTAKLSDHTRKAQSGGFSSIAARHARFYSPTRLTNDGVVELFLVCGRNLIAFEHAADGKTEEVLLRTHGREVIADRRVRLLSLQQVRVLLFE